MIPASDLPFGSFTSFVGWATTITPQLYDRAKRLRLAMALHW
jgi:hypothetical protein